jgi:hypothetical protein
MITRIEPTPVLDGLIGRIETEQAADKKSWIITAIVHGKTFVRAVSITKEQANDKEFIRELTRASFAEFIWHTTSALSDCPKDQWKTTGVNRPWRPTVGRTIDHMPQTLDKARSALNFIGTLPRVRGTHLIEECKNAWNASGETDVLPEISGEIISPE